MMPDLGKYAVEVISTYLVSIGLIVALVGASLYQSRRTKDALRKVEAARQQKANEAAKEDDQNG